MIKGNHINYGLMNCVFFKNLLELKRLYKNFYKIIYYYVQ